MRPLAVALAVAAAAIALVAILVVGQAVSRSMRKHPTKSRRSAPSARGPATAWRSSWHVPLWWAWSAPPAPCRRSRSVRPVPDRRRQGGRTRSWAPHRRRGARHRRFDDRCPDNPQRIAGRPPRPASSRATPRLSRIAGAGCGEWPVAGRSPRRAVRGARRRVPCRPDAQHPHSRHARDHLRPCNAHVRGQPHRADRHAEPLWPGVGQDGRRPVRPGPGDQDHRALRHVGGCSWHRCWQLRRCRRQRCARAGLRSPVRQRRRLGRHR